MSRLPVVSGARAVKTLRKIGYAFDHQRSSHIVLRHVDPPHRRITVPDRDELAKGMLRSILRQVGLTVDEFAALL